MITGNSLRHLRHLQLKKSKKGYPEFTYYWQASRIEAYTSTHILFKNQWKLQLNSITHSSARVFHSIKFHIHAQPQVKCSYKLKGDMTKLELNIICPIVSHTCMHKDMNVSDNIYCFEEIVKLSINYNLSAWFFFFNSLCYITYIIISKNIICFKDIFNLNRNI